jgi:ribose transport system substrate-binding protein
MDQNASIISLNTLDPGALAPEVDMAASAGIPVFIHNTLTPAEGLNISAYIGYNQYKGAAEMGYYAVRKLAEKHNEAPETVQGKVFILRGLPGFHADQRTAGFIAGLAQSPGIRVVGEETAGWDRDTARRIALEALHKDPGIEVFYGNSDEMAIGASLAVRERGKEVNKDVFCLGIDGNTPTLEMIRNGTMTATLGVFPDRMGRVIIEKMDQFRTEGLPGSYFETPAVVVDTDTLDSYLNGSSWTGAILSGPEILYNAS